MADPAPGLTRIYDNPGLPGRPTLSIVVVVLAFFYGLFELWNAWRANFASQLDLMFGLLFVGGGIYGFYQTWTEARDAVVAIDVDEKTDRLAFSLWRPLRPMAIETTTGGVAGWRHFVKVGPRDLRTHMIIASVPGYPRPLRIGLPAGKPVPDGLRKIAREAVAEYEEATGGKSAR
jgi:hypothetical protein